MTKSPRAAGGTALALLRFVLDKPMGEWVHVALAVLYMYLLPLETFPKDLVWHMMALWSTLRFPWLMHRFDGIIHDRLVWLLAGWTAWVALSVLWSPARDAGTEELRTWRVVATPIIILPALRRSSWLIVALLAGVLTQNLVQGAQALALFGMEPAPYGRLGGWVHPITTGAFCVASMCICLAALMNHASLGPRRRAATIAGLVGVLAAATVGLVFTGSRGPWMAAALALPLAAISIGGRRPDARRAAAVLAVSAVLVTVVAWPFAGGFIKTRVDQAISQLQGAIAGDYDSDVGMRVARWRAAVEMIAEHPIAGVGAGGYGPAVQETAYETLIGADDHAHSTYLHEFASRGLVGLGFTMAVIVVIWRRTLVMTPGPLTDGLSYVLVSWVVGAAFDCYELNGNLFGMLTAIAALSLPLQPDAQYKSAAKVHGDDDRADPQQNA